MTETLPEKSAPWEVDDPEVLRDRIRRLERTLADYEAEVRSRDATLEGFRVREAANLALLGKKDAELQVWIDKAGQKAGQKAASARTIKEKDAEIAKLKERIGDQDVEIKDFARRLNQKNVEIKAAKQTIADLEDEVARQKDWIVSQEETIANQIAAGQKLIAKLGKSNQHRELEKVVDDQGEALCDLQEENDRLRSQVAAAPGRCKPATGVWEAIEALQAEVDRLKEGFA